MHPRRRSLHSWSFVLHSIARNGRPKGRLVKDSLKVSHVVFSALVQLFKSRIFARSTRTWMSMLKPRSVAGQPCYNSPAMWQQNVYFAPNHDVLKMFTLDPNTGKLSATPVSKGSYTYLWPGADPVVSSNDNTNGIVWTLDTATSTLHANDASDVSRVLYASPSLG